MKIALLGYGKMGKAIEKLALDAGYQVVCCSGSQTMSGRLDEADVAIEFSTPEAAPANLKICFESGIPVVCGTTAWLKHWDEINDLCLQSNGAMVYASNFSIGVQIFFELQRHLAQVMKRNPEYRASIIERHHLQKLDTPSGTAISIADIILREGNYKKWVLGDAGNQDDLPIHAIREPDTPGTHLVEYKGPIDEISLTHKAHSRDGFASGALLAARWIQGKTGVYSMKDVLHLSDNNSD
jgi:4-hydroxy-tetrahydrodipicolinate reductase